MNINRSALVPRGQPHAAVTTSMLDVLERVHHVRDEAQAQGEAEDHARPRTVILTGLVSHRLNRQTRYYGRRER